MSAREKIAYLKGMLDGLGPVKDEGQNKIFAGLVDALDALSQEVADQDGARGADPPGPLQTAVREQTSGRLGVADVERQPQHGSSQSSEMSAAGAECVRLPTEIPSTPVDAYSRTVPRVIPPDASM